MKAHLFVLTVQLFGKTVVAAASALILLIRAETVEYVALALAIVQILTRKRIARRGLLRKRRACPIWPDILRIGHTRPAGPNADKSPVARPLARENAAGQNPQGAEPF